MSKMYYFSNKSSKIAKRFRLTASSWRLSAPSAP